MTRGTITAEFLLAAYTSGYFPMAESRESPELHWFHPEKRGIIPLDTFHIPRSLAKFMRRQPFSVTTDTAFPDVIQACAARKDTWINGRIIRLYCELWEKGHAHSVECWKDGALAGGLYGVSIAGAFFGESMFSRAPGASKVALVRLVTLLKEAGYRLLDTQYVNDHLKQFGVQEIARKDYMQLLAEALRFTPAQIWARSEV